MARSRSAAVGAGPDPVVERLLAAAEEGSGVCVVVERDGDAAYVDAAVAAGVARGVESRIAVGTSAAGAPFEAVLSLLGERTGSERASAIERGGLDLPALQALAARFDAPTVHAPLLLVVDHADAVDAASARVLSYLAEHLDARRISLLLATVEVPAGSWLDSLIARRGVERHRTHPAVESDPAALDALLDGLDDASRRVVDALAVLGPSPSMATLAAVAGVDAGTALDTLDSLFHREMLRRTPSGVGHLVVDTTVLDRLPPKRRSELHGRAAARARDLGEPVELVAAHLEASTPGSFPWAGEVLRAAAGRALHTGDPARAVSWLQRAIEEESEGEDVPLDLVRSLADAQARAGDPGAIDSLRRVIERTTGPQRRPLRLRLARHLSEAGHLDGAVAILDDEVAGTDRSSAADLLEARTALAAVCRLSLHLRNRSAALLDELTRDPATEATDDPSVLAELAYEHSLAGTDRQVIIDLGERVLGVLGRRAPSPVGAHGLFLALVWAEDHEGARLLCDRLHGDRRLRPVEAQRMGTLALAQGDLDRAVAWSRIAAADIEWVAPLMVPGARAQLARALIRQGDLDGAADALRLPGGDAPWRRHATYHPVLLAHAELAASMGEWRRASSFADACAGFADDMGTHNPAVVPWQLVAAEARAALGSPSEAAGILDDAIVRATAFGAPAVLDALMDRRRSLGCELGTVPGSGTDVGAIELAEPAPDVAVPPPVAPGADRTSLQLLGDTVLRTAGEERRLGDDLVDRAVCIVAVSPCGIHDEQLAEGLWPEGDPAVGRTRLRNVLMRVRQRYGPVLQRRGRTIELAADIAVDVRRFEDLAAEALASADPEVAERLGQEAIALHRGDLCPVHPFETWAVAPRAAVRQRWLALLDRLAELATARGDLTTAVALFEQAVAAEPWDEDRYLDAAERFLRAGRPAAARALLRRSEAMCAELGVPPSRRHQELASAVA